MNDHRPTAPGDANMTTKNLPETVQVETGPNPQFSVIWLHGLGADGHDFEPIVPELRLPADMPVRFIFPHAPVQPVTLNGGMPMRAWYDIRSLTSSRDHDEAGILESSRMVDALVQREIQRGTPASRIVLAGFSQGGAVALYAGLRFKQRLAGLIVLSSYLLFSDRLEQERAMINADLPVFLAHGTQDPVVAFQMGEQSARVLEGLSYPLVWKSYPIPHSVSLPEITDIGNWLVKRFAEATANETGNVD